MNYFLCRLWLRSIYLRWRDLIGWRQQRCLFVAQRPPWGHGLLILEVSSSYTTMHHNRQNSSGRVIRSPQRPLPDNTEYSQHTKIHAPGGIWTHNPAGERSQTYSLDRAATENSAIEKLHLPVYRPAAIVSTPNNVLIRSVITDLTRLEMNQLVCSHTNKTCQGHQYVNLRLRH
jgi:hypothetical protein